MKPLSLFSAALLLLSLWSCQKLEDFEAVDGVKYDASYALPIANTRLSIKDVLENTGELSTLRIDENGLITFEYRGDVISQNSDTLFAAINESLEGSAIPLFSKRFALPLETNEGTSFDRLVFEQGKLSWGFQNPHPEPVEVTLTLPDVYSPNGEVLRLTGSAPAYSGTGDEPIYTTILNPKDLSGYAVVTPPGVDSIFVEYELIRQGVGPDTVSFGALTLNDLSFSYMEGFFGTEVQASGVDTIIIDFFDDWVKGDIYFADPTVTFKVRNSFGIPTRSRVNLFNVFTVRGDILPLESQLVETGIDFAFPGPGEVGQTIVADYVFDKSNSNIDSILGAGPLAIEYDVDAVTHPDGDTDLRGFLTDSSFYEVFIEVDLPLYGNAIDFVARDTLSVGLGDLKEVNRAEFKLVAYNDLPLDVVVQGYFLDGEGMVLDSLFDTSRLVIAGAPADTEGFSTGIGEETTFIDFPEGRFASIKPTQQLILVASFTTVNNGQQSVRLLADQGVDLRLGAIFGRRGE
ncbi:MAG TPA: hypothetical protein VJ933_04930 [Phaeodactylibacter sp.]|nr:hypothetical protein [Phaeodactylibacter sp.]